MKINEKVGNDGDTVLIVRDGEPAGRTLVVRCPPVAVEPTPALEYGQQAAQVRRPTGVSTGSTFVRQAGEYRRGMDDG
ncbi:hypothetical protein UA74_15005 [Actinoalloteichus fjordicus]|uniref:Uncharacterized protein n=1 Tax=Actinoalloteichus fjordicus TaxID=1612552 RepID=A0AAC9LCZ7_9PSEU|nr:hypothetical protein UA74_15005 [Actinoalloteichus fjordicus]